MNKQINALKGFQQKGANGNKLAHLFSKDKNKASALRNTKKMNVETLIDLTLADNKIGALAKIGYVPGSKIGLIISVTCSCAAFIDPELNKQFCKENGEVDFFKLRLVFPHAGVEGIQDGYQRVFTEEEYKMVMDKTGRNHVIMNALKLKIPQFAQQLKELKSCNKEDLVFIGKDLEVISTVISELEIDAAKDEKKREGILDISEYMNIQMKQRSRNIEVINNFKDIISYKKGYSKTIVTELVYEFNEAYTLFDFDNLFKERVEEYYAELNASGEEKDPEIVKEEIDKIKIQTRDECMVMDPLFQVVELMMEAVKDSLNELTTYYVNSDMSLFENLLVDPQRNEENNIVEGESLEEAIYSIRKTAVIMYEMLNNTYMYKDHMSMIKPDDLARIARNIIYSAGHIRGFEPQDTFLIAADAGWYKRSYGKKEKLNKTNYRFTAVEAIFGTELKYYFNEEVMRTEAKIEMPDELLEYEIFEEDMVLEFENGQCVVTIDDEEFTILRIDNVEFTGSILMEVDEEDYVSFVEFVDQYEFDLVDYAVFDNIADVSLDTNSIDPASFEALLVEAETTDGAVAKRYSSSKLIPKRKSDKDENGLLTAEEVVKEAARIAPLLKRWENMIKAEYIHNLNSSFVQNHYCLSDSTGKGRILGKVHDECIFEDEEYNSIYTISTGVGAIMIKNVKEVEEA